MHREPTSAQCHIDNESHDMKKKLLVHVYIDGNLPIEKGPTRHAYALQIGPFWHHTLDILDTMRYCSSNSFVQLQS